MRPIYLAAALALSACSPSIPNSAAGVGFGDYASYTPEQPAATARAPVTPPTSQVVPPISTETMARATPQPRDTSRISDEQDFDAVSARQTIESDAERLERLRSEYQVITPVPVPERGDSGPNIVAFALATNHPVGQPVYRRPASRPSAEDTARRCAAFVSDDAAQREFLTNGGPDRDRGRLDPDGDGYACGWDPSPFRAARG